MSFDQAPGPVLVSRHMDTGALLAQAVTADAAGWDKACRLVGMFRRDVLDRTEFLVLQHQRAAGVRWPSEGMADDPDRHGRSAGAVPVRMGVTAGQQSTRGAGAAV